MMFVIIEMVIMIMIFTDRSGPSNISISYYRICVACPLVVMSERSMEVTSRLIYTGVDYNNSKLGYVLLIILNYNCWL